MLRPGQHEKGGHRPDPKKPQRSRSKSAASAFAKRQSLKRERGGAVTGLTFRARGSTPSSNLQVSTDRVEHSSRKRARQHDVI